MPGGVFITWRWEYGVRLGRPGHTTGRLGHAPTAEGLSRPGGTKACRSGTAGVCAFSTIH